MIEIRTKLTESLGVFETAMKGITEKDISNLHARETAYKVALGIKAGLAIAGGLAVLSTIIGFVVASGLPPLALLGVPIVMIAILCLIGAGTGYLIGAGIGLVINHVANANYKLSPHMESASAALTKFWRDTIDGNAFTVAYEALDAFRRSCSPQCDKTLEVAFVWESVKYVRHDSESNRDSTSSVKERFALSVNSLERSLWRVKMTHEM